MSQEPEPDYLYNYLYNDSALQMDSQYILRIEEIDNYNYQSPLDNCLFIGCSYGNNFYVRGRRNDTYTTDYVPYALHSNDANEVCKFIQFVIGKRKANVILYNYNNLNKVTLTNRTFEFFENNIDANYEVAGYNGISLKEKNIMDYLAILKCNNYT